MKVELHGGRTLTLDSNPLGQGGMGTAYAVMGERTVVKLFHNPTPEMRALMERVIDGYNCTRDSDPTRAAYWSSLYVWPTELVVKPRLGLLMPKYPDGFTNMIPIFGAKNFQSAPPENKRWNQRMMIAWRLSQAVGRLHLTGLAHSDLSQNNLIADAKNGRVRIIDIDGLVAEGFNPPMVLGTPGYIAPEVLAGKATPGLPTDRHALAVLIYQLLLFRHPLTAGRFAFGQDPFDEAAIGLCQLGENGLYIEHPTDFRNHPTQKKAFGAAMLGPTIAGMFERAFVAGLKNPNVRPMPIEWKSALGRLFDRIVTCYNKDCHEKFYPIAEGRPAVCPWCNTKLPLKEGLPILRLYEFSQRGPSLVNDFWIAGYHGRTLHSWHAKPGAEADVFADQTPIARIERRPDRTAWLVAMGGEGLARMDDKGQVAESIRQDGAIKLSPGTAIRLGGAGARMAVVQLLQ